MFTDITEQRTAKAALQEGNRLLGRLRETNVLGVLVADEEAIQEANDAFLDTIGYTRDDLEAGRITWAAIAPRVHRPSGNPSRKYAVPERLRRMTRSTCIATGTACPSSSGRRCSTATHCAGRRSWST